MFFLQLKEREFSSLRTYLCKPYNGLSRNSSFQVYFIIKNAYNLVVSKLFEENWFRFLDACEIPLNTKLIKSNNLLTILNQVNPNLQFAMERSATNLPF